MLVSELDQRSRVDGEAAAAAVDPVEHHVALRQRTVPVVPLAHRAMPPLREALHRHARNATTNMARRATTMQRMTSATASWLVRPSVISVPLVVEHALPAFLGLGHPLVGPCLVQRRRDIP